jgi:predicted lactoylglutathione lyase
MDTMKISFAASSREKVRECYAAAISAGGQDIRAPKLQLQLNPICYSAMVFGPDRHNIEVTTYDTNP